MSIVGAAAIAAGAGLLGQGTNAYMTGKMNKRAERFSKEMYAKQRADALSDWHMTNAYNDPAAQMERMRNAGLNPNLMYGQGTVGNSPGEPRGSSVTAAKFEAPQIELGSIAMQAMQTKQLQANIARTEAETERIRSQTYSSDFKNQLNDLIGIPEMASRYRIASEKLQIENARQEAEFNAWAAGAFDGRPTTDRNSPIALSHRAGFEIALDNLQRAKLTNSAISADNVVRDFKANLAKAGISPDSPWYAKIVGELLRKAGLLDLSSSDSFDLFQFK